MVPLSSFYFFNIWSFLKSLFWMKRIQGSIRVNIKLNTFMHGPSFFSFHFLSFSISFPKLTIFFYFLPLHVLQDVEITARTWEISSWRLVEKFRISAFSMYYSLWNWIGEHEITKLKKYIYLLRIQKKGDKNKHKKTWMKWNDTKWTIWYFQQCACVNPSILLE